MIDWSACPRVPEHFGVDRARFVAEILPAGRPAVLRAAVAHWPAVQAGSARAAYDLLSSRAGPQPVDFFLADPRNRGRFGYRPDLSGFDFTPMNAPLAPLLRRIADFADHPEPPGVYAGAVRVPQVFADGLADHDFPLLDPGCERLVSLWVGNRTVTAAHWDQPQNLACVVAGRRRFTLFPVEQASNLYFGPLDRTPAGQAVSLVDFDAPDLARFPRFVQAAAAAEVAELEPGDVLYMPALWIHHVRSLDPMGAMINAWWRDGPAHLLPASQTLLHALLTLKGMPADERARWRTLFDWLVFADDDPLAHLPEAARGLWGPGSPETRAEIAQRIIHGLAGLQSDQ